MSDDEAFIRGILAAPGDDLPRLIYADWLEEQGDERGTFLRHEVLWAKPWQDGTPPGWSQRIPGRSVPEWDQEQWRGLNDIQDRANGLDPLWVARVSRPPLGVCCDHVKFDKRGPEIDHEDLAAGERRLRCRFPPTLCAFLLNYNGGSPNRTQLVVRCGNDAEGWHWDWVGLDHFASLPARGRSNSRQMKSLESFQDELHYFEEELGGFGDSLVTTAYVPFGSYSSTSVLLMRWAGEQPGRVFGLDLEIERVSPELLVPSLPQLLARIITGFI